MLPQTARKVFAGFTLIELLIVVAIIAILAAIAVPNFLEAQTRAKVSRAKSDQRTLAVALVSYYVDNNHFPPDRNYYNNGGPRIVTSRGTAQQTADRYWLVHEALYPLTTPVAHLSSVTFDDPFAHKIDPRVAFSNLFTTFDMNFISYTYFEGSHESHIALPSLSPDATHCWGDWSINDPNRDPGLRVTAIRSGCVINSIGPDQLNSQGEWSVVSGPWGTGVNGALGYDPTNGTISPGDITRGIGGLEGLSGIGMFGSPESNI